MWRFENVYIHIYKHSYENSDLFQLMKPSTQYYIGEKKPDFITFVNARRIQTTYSTPSMKLSPAQTLENRAPSHHLKSRFLSKSLTMEDVICICNHSSSRNYVSHSINLPAFLLKIRSILHWRCVYASQSLQLYRSCGAR